MDESIRIPVELDISKGLAGMAQFSDVAKKSGNDLQSAFVKAIKPISQLEREMGALEKAIKDSVDPTEIKRFTDQIAKLQTQVNNLRVVGFDKGFTAMGNSVVTAKGKLEQLPRAADRATSSMVDLGRVVQDAPYGFIGIANNINPLLEGFQRLQKETGGTKGALKAMLSSLTGAGGLGLALSLITSALSFASIGFSAWTRGMSSTSDVTKKVKTDMDAFKEVLAEVSATLSQEATKVTTLFEALNSGTLNTAERKKALSELKEINKEYFGSLKEEDGLIKGLQTAYDGYLKRLLDIGRTKAVESQLTKLFDKKLQLELSVDPRFIAATESTVQKQIASLNKELQKIGGAATPEELKGNVMGNEQLQKRIALQQKISELERGSNVSFLADEFNGVNKELSAVNLQIEGLSKLLGDTGTFDIKFDKDKKTKDPFNDIISKAKEVATYLKENTLFKVNYEFSPLDDKATALKKAQSFLDDVSKVNLKLRTDLNLTSFSEPAAQRQIEDARTEVEKGFARGIIIPLKFESSENLSSNFAQNASRLITDIQNAFKSIGVKSPAINMEDPAGFNYNKMLDSLRQYFKAANTVTDAGLLQMVNSHKNAIDGINASIQQMAVDSIVHFADTLGTALAGGDLKNAFSGFVNILASGFSAIGKQMIAASPVIVALKGALRTLNPAILLPAGVALVGIGAALRSTVGKGVTGFADGGLVSGPLMGLVGEGRGTSRNNPEVMAPLDRLKSFFGDMINENINGKNGGSMMGYNQPASLSMPSEVRLFASGKDLLGVFALETQSQNRGG